MNASCDVVFALTGDVRRNSRALRQIRTLGQEGYSVHLLSLDGESSDPYPEGLSVDTFQTPRGHGPRFFRALHTQFQQRATPIRAAVYHASDLFCLPALARAAASHAGRLVYDSRELYTALGASHRRPWASGFWYLVERRYIREADVVLTVNEAIADRLKGLYRIAPPVVLPNVPSLGHVSPAGALRSLARLPGNIPIVLYQGYLKPGRGCLLAVEAVRTLPDISLVFLGEGQLEEEIRATASRYAMEDRVRILPMVHPDELLSLTADADVGLCLIEDLSMSLRLSLPNKLFEYVAAGVPVLGSDLPEIARVIKQFDVGEVARPGDVKHIRHVLAEMITSYEKRRKWARNTRRVQATYDPTRIDARFRETYRTLLPRSNRTDLNPLLQ